MTCASSASNPPAMKPPPPSSKTAAGAFLASSPRRSIAHGKVRRRGAGTRLARTSSRHRPGGPRRRSTQAGVALDGSRRHRRHRGPGPGRFAAGRHHLRQGALPRSTACPLIGVNHIEGHIHAVVCEARGPSRVPRPRAGRQRRPHAPVRSPRRLSTTACSARLATMPPAKPSTKSASCSASAIPADRSSTCSRPTAIPTPSSSPSPR